MEEKIAHIILAFTKAAKALQTYGVGHPKFKDFYTPFYQKIAEFLKNHNELRFQVDGFTILHSDRVVYEETEEDISIAFRLFRDGIRKIGFMDGLTADELVRFLEILGKPPQEQDIALGLWEGAFVHIDFYVVEAEEELLAYEVPDAPVEDIDYDKTITEMIDREKIDVNDVLPQDVSSDELRNLKTEVLGNEESSMLPLVIKTLTDLLSTERSEEVIPSLIEILKQCVGNGDFDNARRIIHALQAHPDSDVMGKLESETTILGFRNLLYVQLDEIFNEFIEFMDLFSKRSIPYFLEMIGPLKRRDRLEALRRKIAHLAQDDPTPILVFLKSEDVAILINAIAILGIMRAKDAASHLRPVIHHTEAMVRAGIISALENIGELSMTAEFLDDRDSDIRLKALRVLTQVKSPMIYQELLRRVKREDFLKLDFPEQRKYFHCLVTNGDDNVMNDLKEILFRKSSLFGNKGHRTMRKLAAIGLAQIDRDEALGILREGVNNKNRDVKTACEMGLRWK